MEKIKDGFKAATQTVLENSLTLKVMFFQAMQLASSGATLGTIAGLESPQLLPIVAGGIYNYKTYRAECNMNKFEEEFSNKLEIIEDKLIDTEKTINYIKNTLIPVVLDNVINETQQDKIKYIVNGIESTINDDLLQCDDITFTYYDILSELRIREINILLRAYSNKDNKAEDLNTKHIENELEAIDRYSGAKLEANGLLSIRKSYIETEGRELQKLTFERLVISKLGIKFIEFFKINYEKNN